MGKKVKEDKKPPPSDVLDPLPVELHQPATVVLMLDSPEVDVLAKAAEAIFKFIEKSEDNKKLMLSLGAVDRLLSLIRHDDRIVRRNAVMAFGLMASHADVRKLLKKREECIPAIIGMMAPEEDTLCHEFAALWLSHMAADFSTKVAIFEQDGLDCLIRGMQSHDPDVQKNSVEGVGLLVQDYQARSAMKDRGGLQPLLDLCKSEFPVIQELALVALDRATQDAGNRAALRELEGLTQLISFVGTPAYSDLHAYAVVVLANCLEDKESVELIKETGGLQKLVAIVTDAPPPEDTSDKKKTAGKGGKDAPKTPKGKKGADDDKHKGGKTSVVDEGSEVKKILPEVKAHAARAISRAAKSAENRKILNECQVEKMLIQLLAHEDVNVEAAAAQALATMAELSLSRAIVTQLEGIEPLVKMLKKDDQPALLEAATLALANLTAGSQTNCQAVAHCGGIEPLIATLGNSKETAVANACCALTNMAADEELRSDLQRSGVVTSLVTPLQSTNADVQSKASLAAAAFMCDSDARTEFRNAGGLECLVDLLGSPSDDTRRSVSWAVCVCAVDEPTAFHLSTLGCLDILQSIQVSGKRKNAFTSVALERLLNYNLPAKYALTGHLGSQCITQDGFYDCGQIKEREHIKSLKEHLQEDDKLFSHLDTTKLLNWHKNVTNALKDEFYDAGAIKPGAKFSTLEELSKKQVDQRRPVLLVNAKADRPPTAKTPEPGPREDATRGATRGGAGKPAGGTGHESKQKSRSQKDKEDKMKGEELELQRQKEAELAAATNAGKEPDKPFVLPPDPIFVRYIEEVREKIFLLPTAREQVVALARFVAEKMGGPIVRGDVGKFSWELHISQIKYERKSNIIPIGLIKAGIHVHRALLFKALADRMALACTLDRGEYNRAWNEVMLFDDDSQVAPKFPPKCYVVDLVHEPGRLMPPASVDAEQYKKL